MNKKLETLPLFVAVTLFFLLAFPNPTLGQTPLFGPQTEYVAASKNGPSGIAVGDFNGDGKVDLAVVNFGDWNIYVLLGDGDGTFQAARSVYVASGGGFPWYVVAADFNGDGKLDLAVSNYQDNSLSVLLGNGDGTFQAPQTTPVGTNPAKIAVGDFNGDGKPDLAVSSVANGTVSVLLGKGDGTFLPPLVTPAGANPWYFAVGDFNGDGKLDLAVADYGCPLDCNRSPSNTVTVLLGNGDGTFLPGTNLTVGNGPADVAVGDFNGDGRLDLAVTNLNDNTLSVLLGNGDGTFQAPQTFADPGMTHPYFVAVSDFNGDGKLDLVVSNELNTTVSVLLGNGDGTFQAAQDFAVDNDPVFVAVQDFNGDGRPDLAVANLHALSISVLLNTTGASAVATPTFSPGGGTYTGSVTVTISDSTIGATIYYTTDGSTPTTSSPVYSGALTFTQTTTLNAMAAATGMTNSAVASATYTVQQQQQVATPTFSPGGGTYTGSVTVSISDATSGATIHYTTDGSTPTTSSPVYSGALTFTKTTTLKAMAAASGMTNSGVASATYTIQQQQVATPTFSPGGGTYTGSVTVSISDATSGAAIHYTTDGSTPTTSSPVYSGALTFTQTTTLKAMAAASGMTNSGVASATYTVQQQPVATPTFSPGGGTYTGLVAVTISDATSGATIHYTTDGSMPTTSSAVYSTPLTFTQTTTLKAMAAATGMANSPVASATYTVQQQLVATPICSPGGTYTGLVTATISDATSGATIYYTTDGSTPTTSSAVYTGALTFTRTTTLKAIAAASGMANSAVTTAIYTIRFTLTVSTTDLGSGTVTSSPAGINCGSTCSGSYLSGTTVTLTAAPALLSGFGGWTGCDSVSGDKCTVSMDSARSVTADFKLLGLL